MFVRLTRHGRIRAGWFVALLYLFCVVAPGAALALGSAAPWLAHDLKPGIAAHDHYAAQQHRDAHADHRSGAGGSHHHEQDGTSKGPCCAMLCLSTMAADLPSIAKPSQPVSVRAAESFRRLPDKAPSRLYKPPIA